MFSVKSKPLMAVCLAGAVITLAGCEALGPKTLDEIRNSTFGKQYNTRELVREINVDGRYYKIYRRAYDNFTKGSQAQGVDYTVNVMGTNLACDAGENTVDQCIIQFEDRIPAQLREAARRNEGGDDY